MNKNGYRPAGRERAGLAARNTAAHMLERVVDGGQSLDRLCDNDHGLTAYRALIAKDRALVRAIVTTA